MNTRLFNEFVEACAKAPDGYRAMALVAMVAEHCATICEIDPKHAAETIRAAFVPSGDVQLKPVAQAAQAATH